MSEVAGVVAALAYAARKAQEEAEARAQREGEAYRHLQDRLAYIEARLKVIEAALGITPPPPPVPVSLAAVDALAAMGQERAEQEEAAQRALEEEREATDGSA